MKVFHFWRAYSWFGLMPLIAVVFGRIDGEFLSEGFWNQTTLKMTLSMTPLLLLPTFHTEIITLNGLTNFQRVTKRSLKTIVPLTASNSSVLCSTKVCVTTKFPRRTRIH